MRWIEISVTVDPEVAEAVSEVFNRLNPAQEGQPSAVIEIDGFDPVGDVHHLQATVRTYIVESPEGWERARRIETALGHLNLIQPVPQPHIRVIDEEDWAHAWKKHYHPLRVGRRLVILPVWEEVPAVDKEMVIIRLDPGLAFGTGLHPTTRLALQLLEDALTPKMDVLDVGTGSGILAIAAALLGAKHVVATDIDPQAIAAARKNIQENRVENRVEVREGSLPRNETFDLVVVNILPHVILNLLDRGLWNTVREGGHIILSGIIEDRETDILLSVSARGGHIIKRVREGDWIGLWVRK